MEQEYDVVGQGVFNNYYNGDNQRVELVKEEIFKDAFPNAVKKMQELRLFKEPYPAVAP